MSKDRAESISSPKFFKIVTDALKAGKTRKETIALLGMKETSFNTRMTGFRKHYAEARKKNPNLPELLDFKGSTTKNRIDESELDRIIAESLGVAYATVTTEVTDTQTEAAPNKETTEGEVQPVNVGAEQPQNS